MEYKANATGQYEPVIEFTSDPYEKELMQNPIGKWGKLWQQWIENQYPSKKTLYIIKGRWPIIPREIDIEAEKRWWELDEIYRKTHKRPDGEDFLELSRWEKERLLYLDHRVMEEVVYKLRPYDTAE